MDTTLAARWGSARQPAYAALAALLLAALVAEAIMHGTGVWQIAAFGIGPDLALLAGVGRGLARGQLHPRAVPLYNLAHRVWGPLVLVVMAAAGVLPVGFLIGGLAWGLHVAVDRAVGYGLRSVDGFQRS
jgi:uncharacterized protein DUF4260